MEMVITDEIKQRIADHNHANPYTDITPFELHVSWPTVVYQGFHPDSDEILIYAAPAATYKDKTQTVGYAGRSGSVSVRVAKGVSLRSGSSGSRAIKGTVRQTNNGDLLITSKRVLFIGKDDSFEYPLTKISAVKMLDGCSFTILAGNSSRNISLDGVLPAYAYTIIDKICGSQAANLYADIRSDQSKLTQDQIMTCTQIREECAQMRPTGAKTPAGCLGSCLKYMLWGILGAFAIFMAFGLLLYSCSSGFTDTGDDAGAETTTETTAPQYSSEEILNLSNHPRLYDSWDDAGFFYENVDGVLLMTTSEYANVQRTEGARSTEDPNVLYLLHLDADESHVGYMEAFIRDDYVPDMTVDTAAKLLVSYLPEDFFKYYRKDSSYTKNNGNNTIYVCSYRLNDDGVAYSNDGHDWYSYYYSCYIGHFFDPEYWSISTDYSAYGKMDLEWIQKYGGEWDVDLKDYQ